jgi:hypothetical protein
LNKVEKKRKKETFEDYDAITAVVVVSSSSSFCNEEMVERKNAILEEARDYRLQVQVR